MSPTDFEARYLADPDPWSYGSSEYERQKYAATLDACGEGPYAAALELGGSIGVFSEMLAPRCLELVTIDAAPTAVSAARQRLRPYPRTGVILGAIPEAIPEQPFDLVVASEILYYLSPGELAGTFTALERRIVQGGRLVAVHWRPAGPERPFDAHQVHQLLREQSWLHHVSSGGTDDYRLDVLERR
jgi:predicted TPR repeat methyltransferase